MGGSHSHRATSSSIAAPPPTSSRRHRVGAAEQLVVLGAFVLAVVSTPVRAVWAFAAYGLILLVVLRWARVPLRTAARRTAIEAPFVLFALALPFIGTGPRTDVLGVSVSVAGSWAAWGLVARATCCVLAAVVVSSTTPVADLLEGFDRLRVPRTLTSIASFMVRYLDVVGAELRRLQIARISRGDDPRWFWQGRAVAATAAALAIRSFERGERVQWAMTSRGFDGTFPDTSTRRTPLRWWPAVLPALVAWGIAFAAIVDHWGSA